MDDVTFIVHTFKRPEQLKMLRESIDHYYPNVEVIVYDDSDYDRGLSWGRNHMIDQVQTKYFLLLDDDFEFCDQTRIQKLVDKADQGYDIVAGSLIENGEVIHYEGRYELGRGVLKYIPSLKEPFDFVLNFFIGRTSTFRKIKWDERLKLAEHTAFFLKNKGNLKIGYVPEVQIRHKPFRSGEYGELRERGEQFFKDFMKREGITSVVGFDGSTLEIDLPHS